MPPNGSATASDRGRSAMERLLTLNRKAGQEAAATADRARRPARRPSPRSRLRDSASQQLGASEPGVRRIPLDQLRPNPDQPRQVTDDGALDELTDSIRAQGVIQPLLVRPHPDGDGAYQIVVGERRYTAARRAGLEAVPCIIRSLDDRQTFLVSVTENVAREDLNPIDEAAAYRRMLDQGYAANQGEIAGLIGIHRTRVSRKLKLLTLDPRIQAHLRSAPAEALSLTHLEELTRLEAGDTQHELYRAAVARGLSTRELHARVEAQLAPRPRRRPCVSRTVVALDSGARITVYPTHVALRIPRQPGDDVGLPRIVGDLEAIAAELRSRLDS